MRVGRCTVRHTHDIPEWIAYLSLGASVYAAWAAFCFLFVDATRADFPRLWQAAVHARHDMARAAAAGQRLARDAAITAAALYMLLTINPESAR